MFVETRFICTKMATSFRKSIGWQPPSLNVTIVLISDSTVAVNIELATSSPNLVRIGQVLKKLLKFFAIQDGGSRHLDFRWICVSWRFSAFGIRFATFSTNLVRTGLIVKKWQQLFRFQDGGRRHLQFRKSVAISLILDQSSPNLVGMLIICHRTQLLY